ncbi:hypothetical protein NEIFLAOT_01838 [Neisseria flavescens NRL30031/H210]|uniref:Uncharacterized protein n=1 Tax=Neisseria flavescens NRL30031/H210 TaxID=546264 RepID=C0EPE8_NEIFL|nr:hypothetical protein NEIFLAOT_01838 [Neisseria flavescens NRL30031/H210]
MDTLPVCNTKQYGLKKGRLNGWVSDGLLSLSAYSPKSRNTNKDKQCF